MKTKKLYIIIGLMGFLLTVMTTIMIMNSLSSKEDPTLIVEDSAKARSSMPSYKFAYMKTKCTVARKNYIDEAIPKLSIEQKSLTADINSAYENGDTKAFDRLKDQGENLLKSSSMITDRIAKLEACIQSVNNEVEFSATELAELNSFAVSSKEVPSPY